MRVCLGTYTVTETVAPPGFALPADPDRVVTVSADTLNVSIGTIGATDEFDFHNRLGSIAWEKRDDQGVLQGGATFTVGGATLGPFACHDADTTGDDDLNPVTVVDDTDGVVGPGLDQDPDAGQFLLVRVCLGTYTVTETVAPPGFALPADPDRVVTVSADTLNVSIGTIGATDEFDFHNRLGSIAWEKRDDQGVLQGGATFTVGGARSGRSPATTPTPPGTTTSTRSRSSMTPTASSGPVSTRIPTPASSCSCGSASAPTR